MAQEIETLAGGSLNPVVDTRMDMLPHAHLTVGRVLKHGMKYEQRADGSRHPDNWKGVPVPEHINHAIRHLYLWLSGDDGEEHLEHAAARVLMAVELTR